MTKAKKMSKKAKTTAKRIWMLTRSNNNNSCFCSKSHYTHTLKSKRHYLTSALFLLGPNNSRWTNRTIKSWIKMT